MNRFLRLLLVFSTLALAVSTTGCKKFRKTPPFDAGAVSSPEGEGDTESTEDKADELLSQKVGEYIRHCMNTMSSAIFASRRTYNSWAPKSGITGREARILGLPSVSGAAKCLASANKAKAMQPDDKTMEDVGMRYAKAVVAAEDVIKEASTYYDQKNYKDDKFAKGKALHPRLLAAFEEFVKADKDIHSTIGSTTKPLAQRQLARIEKEEGKKFRWHRRNVLNIGRELVETGDPSDEEHEVLYTSYDNAFKDFEKAFTALRDYGSLHRADLTNTKRAKIGASMAYDNYVRAADDFLRKSRDYARCLRDAPALAKTKDGKVDLDKLPRCPDGGSREFGDKYDAFIITSNANSFPY